MCSVSLRSGRIAGPASSQPRPAAINTVTTPTAVYNGILRAVQQDAVGADADRHQHAALLVDGDGAHPVLDAVHFDRRGARRQRRQLQAALEHHLPGGFAIRPVVSTPRRGSGSWSGYMLASTMESSRRSSCAASLFASTTDVRIVNTATTADAAAAAAMATRVRSEAERQERRGRSAPALRLVPQHVPDPANGVNDPRQAVAFELAPQVGDEHVGDVGVDVEVVAPHQLEQPLPD